MPDVELTCKDCGGKFVFDEKEQKRFEELVFEQPKRCKPCRATKEELRQISGEVVFYLQSLEVHPEIICKMSNGSWASVKLELLKEIAGKAMQLYLAHGGGGPAEGVAKHWLYDRRCVCGCPHSLPPVELGK